MKIESNDSGKYILCSSSLFGSDDPHTLCICGSEMQFLEFKHFQD